MRAKRISVIMLAIGFLLAAIFSCVFVFSVSKVQVSFAVSSNFNSAKVQESLDVFKGKNLLFLNEDEVYSILKEERYLEVLSVEKEYPNVLNISLKERVGIYHFQYNSKYYLIDETGFVLEECATIEELKELTKQSPQEKFIEFSTHDFISNGDIVIGQPQLGNFLEKDEENLLNVALAMTKEIYLTDCIKKVELNTIAEMNYVDFYTYTGVTIRVVDVYDKGVERIAEAFELYDKQSNDYIKSFSKIICVANQEPVWTENFNNYGG